MKQLLWIFSCIFLFTCQTTTIYGQKASANKDKENKQDENTVDFDEEKILYKVELYKELERWLSKGWKITERGDNYIITKENVIVVNDRKGFETSADPRKEESFARIRYTSKPFEITIRFEKYSLEKYLTQKNQKIDLVTALDDLEKKYRLDEIYYNKDTGLYVALEKDEKNRLAKYYLAKEAIQGNMTDAPIYYVRDYGVYLDYKKDYFRIFPQQIEREIDKIVLYIGEILSY